MYQRNVFYEQECESDEIDNSVYNLNLKFPGDNNAVSPYSHEWQKWKEEYKFLL